MGQIISTVFVLAIVGLAVYLAVGNTLQGITSKITGSKCNNKLSELDKTDWLGVDDLGLGCYACPPDTNRTGNPITGPNACSHKCSTVKTQDGKQNYKYDDAWGDAVCYACPDGYYRNANSVHADNACTKDGTLTETKPAYKFDALYSAVKLDDNTTEADFENNEYNTIMQGIAEMEQRVDNTESKGGEIEKAVGDRVDVVTGETNCKVYEDDRTDDGSVFYDVGLNKCFSCPKGYERSVVHSVTSDKACFKKNCDDGWKKDITGEKCWTCDLKKVDSRHGARTYQNLVLETDLNKKCFLDCSSLGSGWKVDGDYCWKCPDSHPKRSAEQLWKNDGDKGGGFYKSVAGHPKSCCKGGGPLCAFASDFAPAQIRYRKFAAGQQDITARANQFQEPQVSENYLHVAKMRGVTDF